MGTRGPALELVTDCLEKQDRAQELCMCGQGWRVSAQRRDLIKLRSSQINLLGLGEG